MTRLTHSPFSHVRARTRYTGNSYTVDKGKRVRCVREVGRTGASRLPSSASLGLRDGTSLHDVTRSGPRGVAGLAPSWPAPRCAIRCAGSSRSALELPLHTVSPILGSPWPARREARGRLPVRVFPLGSSSTSSPGAGVRLPCRPRPDPTLSPKLTSRPEGDRLALALEQATRAAGGAA